MTYRNNQGVFILKEDGARNDRQGYRLILEVLARFGYASVDEVAEGLGLTRKHAFNRLGYLESIGLIRRFPSQTRPESFHCLTKTGRQSVRDFQISDDVPLFFPCNYVRETQLHHRSIVKVFLALKNLWGRGFRGWITERDLESEESWRRAREIVRHKRILDGVLLAEVWKERFAPDPTGGLKSLGAPEPEDWQIGIEVELTLKSAPRYDKQFEDLARLVYDSWNNVLHYPMMIFLCGSPMIHEKITAHLKDGQNNFGACVFYVARLDEFLRDQGGATLERIIRGVAKTIRASEMGEIRIAIKKS